MALAAAQVVDALAALMAPLPATAGRVFTSRWHPLSEAQLPCWRLYVAQEDVLPATVDGVNEHRLTVHVEGNLRAAVDADDAMHAMAAAALAALFAAPVPHALQLLSIDRNVASEAEASIARVRLRVQATFYAAPSAPETILS